MVDSPQLQTSIMLTKATAKFIKSLQLKKYRKREGRFVVEGIKSVLEVLHSVYETELVLGTADFLEQNKIRLEGYDTLEVGSRQLSAVGNYANNDGALAVVKIPNEDSRPQLQAPLTLALDTINDPGNFGTIIRLADWYGIQEIITTRGTVDVYNPKVIAAAKGSFTRVRVFIVDLPFLLGSVKMAIYGAVMAGNNIYEEAFSKPAIIVMGNEANGISPEVEALLHKKITIPKRGSAESLNVAMATAVICDNFFRQV